MAIIFALTDDQSLWARPDAWLRLVLQVIIFSVLALALLRVGVVANIAIVLFGDSMERIDIDPSFSACYTPCGLATLMLLLSMGASRVLAVDRDT